MGHELPPEPTDTGPSESDTDTDSDTDADTDTAPACGRADSPQPACASCAELLATLPDTPDGPATLQPADAPLDTWCDMTTAGGGWTLVGTNAWTGAWNNDTVIDGSPFGSVSLETDFKSEGFASVVFADLLFESGDEYAVYPGVGTGTSSYHAFQETVPLHNCGLETDYEWLMSEGTLADADLCNTNLYIHPIDWEGGLIPCGDSEVATGPAWSGQNKDLGCPLNDPRGTSYIEDPWDYNPWGDHDPAVPNLPLRMWVR